LAAHYYGTLLLCSKTVLKSWIITVSTITGNSPYNITLVPTKKQPNTCKLICGKTEPHLLPLLVLLLPHPLFVLCPKHSQMQCWECCICLHTTKIIITAIKNFLNVLVIIIKKNKLAAQNLRLSSQWLSSVFKLSIWINEKLVNDSCTMDMLGKLQGRSLWFKKYWQFFFEK